MVLANGLNFLCNDFLTIDTDVLKKNMADEFVMACIIKVSDLVRFIHKLKIADLRFTVLVQLVDIFFEGFKEEVLSFLAHDFDLAGDSFVHFFLSLNCFFCVKLL